MDQVHLARAHDLPARTKRDQTRPDKTKAHPSRCVAHDGWLQRRRRPEKQQEGGGVVVQVQSSPWDAVRAD
ncbi:MAG: hypothetical protein M1837_002049, partial [Sclerophora amabilis]